MNLLPPGWRLVISSCAILSFAFFFGGGYHFIRSNLLPLTYAKRVQAGLKWLRPNTA